jgi:hypothetical protein
VPTAKGRTGRIACSAASHAHGLWAGNRLLLLRRRCNYTAMAFTPKHPPRRPAWRTGQPDSPAR